MLGNVGASPSLPASKISTVWCVAALSGGGGCKTREDAEEW